MKAESLHEFSEVLRRAPHPLDRKESKEYGVVRSWAYSPIFTESMPSSGPFELSRGEDPPDFAVTFAGGKISIEVTSFTSSRFEIFGRERSGPGLFTSTLRVKKADKEFWTDLHDGTLPDDSLTIPHAESIADLDADFANVATKVLTEKMLDLARYGSDYSRRFLLIYDRLSTFTSEMERRRPFLRSVLDQASSTLVFDAVILVNGNHYPSETSVVV